MKLTKKALLAKQPMFLNDFEDVASVVHNFEVGYTHRLSKEEQVKAVEEFCKTYKVLFADYTYEDYSGDAYVFGYLPSENLFFEVHGGHCSCYGLEGQWDVETHTKEQLEALFAARKWDKKKEDTDRYYHRYAQSSVEFQNWLKGE